MSTILLAVVPLFAAIVAGFLAGKGKVLDEVAVRGLNTFVFTFAMPPMLFRLMATTDVLAIGEWRFVAGYFYAEALVFLAGSVLGGLLFRQRFSAMTMQGFGSSFSNGVLIALPLLIGLYGERGAVPAVLLFTLDVVLFSLVTMLLEASRSDGRASGWRAVRTTGRALLKNPILMSTLLGILYGMSGLGLPDLVDKTFGFIGQAGPPAALFGWAPRWPIAGSRGASGPPDRWPSSSCSCTRR